MPTPVMDTVIIGSGPAGSTIGALLARAGQKVLLVEKETFPRFHIGESLLPFGNDVLKDSGAWSKIEAAGFQRKLGAEFCTGNGARFQRFWFARGLVPGYGLTYQVERARFDQLLLEHAVSCGCEVRQPCAAKAAARDKDGWRVTLAEGEVRSRWPDTPIALHLHDTRGLAVANAHAGLKMGVTQFDSTVGGLGGCPFAGQPKAAGNICTEELVLLCEEMGIDTGVDLDALIEVGRMAEEIVGHQLPGELVHAGSLDAFRRRAAA